MYVCSCWDFTAQSTQWGQVERSHFTYPHFYWAGSKGLINIVHIFLQKLTTALLELTSWSPVERASNWAIEAGIIMWGLFCQYLFLISPSFGPLEGLCFESKAFPGYLHLFLIWLSLVMRNNEKNTVDSHYLEFQGTLWNISRYQYLDIPDFQNLGKNNSNSHI